MTFREAGDGDVAALVAIVNAAFRVEAFFKIGDRTDADDVRARMRRGRFLVAEDEAGGLAGAVFIATRGRRGYFGMLSIDPARQGQGLGARLTRLAEDTCREAGCTAMEIEVVNLREELPPYYRRLGYVERGTRPFPDVERTSRPCHFIVMDKDLRA
jgi:GNAT superfamily N-acetyltransferase